MYAFQVLALASYDTLLASIIMYSRRLFFFYYLLFRKVFMALDTGYGILSVYQVSSLYLSRFFEIRLSKLNMTTTRRILKVDFLQ